jgi:hypothetical protein
MHFHGSFPWKPHEYDQEQLNGKVSNLLAAGVTQDEVANFVGHANRSTMARYARLDKETK